MTSEVKKTLKEMKNSKALDKDNPTSDVMMLGGEESVKQIYFSSDLTDKKGCQLNGRRLR